MLMMLAVLRRAMDSAAADAHDARRARAGPRGG